MILNFVPVCGSSIHNPGVRHNNADPWLLAVERCAVGYPEQHGAKSYSLRLQIGYYDTVG